MALGAGMWQVLLPLLRWGAAAASMGVLAGWAGSFLFARLLGSLLYSVGSADVTTLAASTVAIWAVVLVACWVPARRAVQIDPVEALRGE
jgi:ABC-type lipoprotein release transport system permease subunit